MLSIATTLTVEAEPVIKYSKGMLLLTLLWPCFDIILYSPIPNAAEVPDGVDVVLVILSNA